MPSKLSGEGGQPEPQLWGRREVTLSGAARESLGAQLRCGGWTEVRTARACKSMSMVEPRGPRCGPKPIVGPCAIPLELLGCSALLSVFLLQVCLFWNGTVLPGTSATH